MHFNALMRLLIFPLLLLEVQTLASNGDSEGVECRKDNLVEVEEGQQLNLIASVKQGGYLSKLKERCIFVFQHPKEGYECCFGSEQECVRQEQGIKNEERCQSMDVDILQHSSTCIASMSNVNKAHAGLYKVFNSKGDVLQECHLVVIVSKTNPWKVAFFVLISFVACLSCIVACLSRIVAQKLFLRIKNLMDHQLQL